MEKGARFFAACLNANATHVAVENPVMHGYAVKMVGRRQDFTCQPWQFGDPVKKRICFWTRNLPPLRPTNILPPEVRTASVHLEPPGPLRWMNRSRFFPGVAAAMARQWGREGRRQRLVLARRRY